MKKTLYIFAAMVLVLMVCSCEEKEWGVVPQFSGITVSPSPAVVGDSITATVNMKVQGKGAYPKTITWKVGGKTKTIKDPQVGYDYVPTYTFAVDAPGTYTVSCSVDYQMQFPMESGQISASASTSGTFKAVSK